MNFVNSPPAKKERIQSKKLHSKIDHRELAPVYYFIGVGGNCCQLVNIASIVAEKLRKQGMNLMCI